MSKTKNLLLYKLDGITPTIESTMIKLAEETGELAELVGKYRRMSGETATDFNCRKEMVVEMGLELFDVAQTCASYLFILEEIYDLNIDDIQKRHYEKLLAKGYIKE